MMAPYPTIPPYLRKSLKLTVLVLVAIVCSAPIALAQKKGPAQIPPKFFDLSSGGEEYVIEILLLVWKKKKPLNWLSIGL